MTKIEPMSVDLRDGFIVRWEMTADGGRTSIYHGEHLLGEVVSRMDTSPRRGDLPGRAARFIEEIRWRWVLLGSAMLTDGALISAGGWGMDAIERVTHAVCATCGDSRVVGYSSDIERPCPDCHGARR